MNIYKVFGFFCLVLLFHVGAYSAPMCLKPTQYQGKWMAFYQATVKAGGVSVGSRPHLTKRKALRICQERKNFLGVSRKKKCEFKILKGPGDPSYCLYEYTPPQQIVGGIGGIHWLETTAENNCTIFNGTECCLYARYCNKLPLN